MLRRVFPTSRLGRLGLVLAVVLRWGSAPAQAAPVTVPTGLTAGDTYHLIFVTAGFRDATSANIADYDAFVTAQAGLDADLAALGTTWKVIGSTDTVNAHSHISVIGPVYNLAGQIVATGLQDLFDGTPLTPIKFNRFGAPTLVEVWTGSEANGEAFDPFHHTLGSASPVHGISTASNFQWIVDNTLSPFNQLALYGISGPLVVPTTSSEVPEPASILLLATGGLGVLVTRRRRQKQD